MKWGKAWKVLKFLGLTQSRPCQALLSAVCIKRRILSYISSSEWITLKFRALFFFTVTTLQPNCPSIPCCQKALRSLRQCTTLRLKGTTFPLGPDRRGQSRCFRAVTRAALVHAQGGETLARRWRLGGGESFGGKESSAAKCRAGVVYVVPWQRWGRVGGVVLSQRPGDRLTGSGTQLNWWEWERPTAWVGPSAAPPVNRLSPGRGVEARTRALERDHRFQRGQESHTLHSQARTVGRAVA